MNSRLFPLIPLGSSFSASGSFLTCLCLLTLSWRLQGDPLHILLLLLGTILSSPWLSSMHSSQPNLPGLQAPPGSPSLLMPSFLSLRGHCPLPKAWCLETFLMYYVWCFSYFWIERYIQIVLYYFRQKHKSMWWFLNVLFFPVVFKFTYYDNILVFVIWDGIFQSKVFLIQIKIPTSLLMFRMLSPGSWYIKLSRVRRKHRNILPIHCQASKV